MESPHRVAARRLVTCAALALVATVAPARAHDPGLSGSTIAVSEDRIEIRLRISDETLDRAEHSRTDASVGGALDGTAFNLSVDGQPLQAASSRTFVAERGHRDLAVVYERPAGRRLSVAVALLERLPRGHKHHARATIGSRAAASAVLSKGADTLAVDLTPTRGSVEDDAAAELP